MFIISAGVNQQTCYRWTLFMVINQIVLILWYEKQEGSCFRKHDRCQSRENHALQCQNHLNNGNKNWKIQSVIWKRPLVLKFFSIETCACKQFKSYREQRKICNFFKCLYIDTFCWLFVFQYLFSKVVRKFLHWPFPFGWLIILAEKQLKKRSTLLMLLNNTQIDIKRFVHARCIV